MRVRLATRPLDREKSGQLVKLEVEERGCTSLGTRPDKGPNQVVWLYGPCTYSVSIPPVSGPARIKAVISHWGMDPGKPVE